MPGKKKIIAYSLWGENPKYTVGAVKNAELAKKFYPEWISRFYVDESTPETTIAAIMKISNTEIVQRGSNVVWKGLAWRFEALSDSDVEVALFRDTDSRLSERESLAVEAWLKSGMDCHIMRDHPYHSAWPILGGMWGARCDAMRDMVSLLDKNFYNSAVAYKWGVDQVFLARFVHPVLCFSTLVHDELSPPLEWDAVSIRENFPLARVGLDFVGQSYDENDQPDPEHLEPLTKRLAG